LAETTEHCSRLRVYVLRLPEDSPDKSTAMKLVRLGLAEKFSRDVAPSGFVVLDPFADTVLHRHDAPRGLIVVDRSWKRLLEEGRLSKPAGGMRRRLPALRAANPINYAKLYVLSSAEALAASLYILGCRSRARELLSPFKWGDEFFKLNGDVLDSYAEAASREELILREKRFLERFHESPR